MDFVPATAREGPTRLRHRAWRHHSGDPPGSMTFPRQQTPRVGDLYPSIARSSVGLILGYYPISGTADGASQQRDR